MVSPLCGLPSGVREPPAARDSGTGQQRQVTVVPGVPRYHTDNCILIRFMDDGDGQQMLLKAAKDAGRTPAALASPATDSRGDIYPSVP